MKKVNRKNRQGQNYVTRYTKRSSRPLFYKVKDKQHLENYPSEIKLGINYKKYQPDVNIQDRKIIWKAKGKPTIIIDFETQDIYSDMMENTTQRIKSNNQASHVICATKKIGRMITHYGKRRRRNRN